MTALETGAKTSERVSLPSQNRLFSFEYILKSFISERCLRQQTFLIEKTLSCVKTPKRLD